MSTIIVLGGDGPCPVIYNGGDGLRPLVGEGPHPLQVSSGTPLHSRLTVDVNSGDVVSLANPCLELALTFQRRGDHVQRFFNREYLFAVLDSAGQQIEDAVFLPSVIREIVLTGRSTTDVQFLFLNARVLKPGASYQLVAAVRNLVGVVQFNAVP